MKVTLAPGHAPQWITCSRPNFPGMTAFEILPGQVWDVVPDESLAPGIGQTLAQAKIDQGLFVLVPEAPTEIVAADTIVGTPTPAEKPSPAPKGT